MEVSRQTGRWWKIARYTLRSMLGGPQSGSGEFLKKENSFSLKGPKLGLSNQWVVVIAKTQRRLLMGNKLKTVCKEIVLAYFKAKEGNILDRL